jgi:hypothetical protein
MVAAPPKGNVKYPKNKDGEVFHLNSSMATDVTELSEEQV